MIALYGAFAWLPFSVGLVVVEVAGVTLTLYIVAMAIASVLSFVQLMKGGGANLIRATGIALVVLNIQMIALLVIPPSATYAHLLRFVDVASPAYKYVHGLLVPTATYFTVSILVRSEVQLRRAVLAFMLGVTVFGVFYIVEIALSPSFQRVTVFGRDAIAAACFFSVAFIFAYGSPILSARSRLLCIAISIISLVSTLSRGFLVATILFATVAKRLATRAVIAVFLGFVVGSLVLTYWAVSQREIFAPAKWDPALENSLERLVNIDYWKNGIYGRLETFEPSMRRFEEAPVFGFGFGGTIAAGTVHNFHMEWLETSGAFGYALFLIAFASHFWRLRRSRASDPWLRCTSLGIMVIFANGLLNGVLHGVMPYVLMMLLGLADARLGMIERGAVSAPSDARGGRRIAPVWQG